MCPKCGGEMAEGTVSASRPLKWRGPEDGLFSSALLTSFWTASEMAAYLCRNCRLILLDYGSAV
jgi:hypothetical protein